MGALFASIILLLSVLALLLGVMQPTIFGATMTRNKAIRIFGLAALVGFIWFAIVAKKEDSGKPEVQQQSAQAPKELQEQSSNTSDSSAVRQEQPQGENPDANLEDDVKTIVKSGLVVRMVPELNEMYVDPTIWSQLDYQMKENIARRLGAYCGMKKGTGTKRVEIKDNYSGKVIAKIGVMGGFETY